jgi:hypothetical protein
VAEEYGKQIFLGNSEHGKVFSRAGYKLKERFIYIV